MSMLQAHLARVAPRPARALLMRPESAWQALTAQMLSEAHLADLYRRRSGRCHPRLGNGTLMSAAFALHTAPEPPASDARYLCAMGHVIVAVIEWRQRLAAE